MNRTILSTHAMVQARYSDTSARCSCQDTIHLQADGEWVHANGSVYCRMNAQR